MHIDFHTHANLSKKINVSLEDFKTKMQEAKASGLTAIAITEHFNATNIINLYETLSENYSYEKDYYMIEGMKVFCGLEVDVKENGHFLVIGSRDDILTIAYLLLPYHDEDNFIPVKDLINILSDFNVLKIGAHPLRKSTPWHHHETSVLEQFDAYDLNGKDLFTDGREMENKVHTFAEKYEVPVVGGSDTHQQLQYGSIANVFPECNTIDELREAIQQRDYEVKVSPCLEEKVKGANQVKKLLKELNVKLKI
ncbi:PHP domain-containing protein [Pseudogracilibacillus sp. ICA-222130]|uniref:PHP domain-containing protein n=1 Tax=Pseudogracilibacillus sp. ICA-222130 TaxID=3134655 RepID=UPI0030BCCBC0